MKMSSDELTVRYTKYSYDPMCRWVYHSEYFGYTIERCFFGDQPKALYRIITEHPRKLILGESVQTIRANFKKEGLTSPAA